MRWVQPALGAITESERHVKVLICRITGHEWLGKNIKDYVREDGEDMTLTTWIQLPHCQRCGEPNPNYRTLEASIPKGADSVQKGNEKL